MYNPFSLSGKTIFVTGASSGIGKATAIECSKMGARLIITGRNEERLNDTFQRLEGEEHVQIIADLNIDEDLELLIDQIPPLDGIVHCAGIVMTIPFPFISKEKMDSIFAVNFFSPTLITQKLLKEKKIKNNSSIVFISSISGVMCTTPANSMYSASKGAVNGMVKGMALDLAHKKIRVNCVNPGMINTSILEEGVITEDQLQEYAKAYPLKRFGNPEEVAYAAIYLLSDASAWTTGSNLLLDGGITL